MGNETLTHWGIKGMKWGRRRYQNKDGSLTPEGKKRYSDNEPDDETPEAREERKQKALKSGSASEVLKFKGELTKAEMDAAIQRIRWEQDMASLSAKEIPAGKNKADKFFSDAEKATKNLNTMIKLYNTGANIANAFSNSDISLPKIDADITTGNRKLRREEMAKRKAKEKEEEERKKREEAERKKREEENG